jgi:hypothetical protein
MLPAVPAVHSTACPFTSNYACCLLSAALGAFKMGETTFAGLQHTAARVSLDQMTSIPDSESVLRRIIFITEWSNMLASFKFVYKFDI